MKLLLGFVLLCAIGCAHSKLKGCKVAAVCDYQDGSTVAEYRPLPTQRQANLWSKIPKPAEGTVTTPTVNKCGEPGWITGQGGYQYKIFGATADWATARDLCRLKGAELPYRSIKVKSNYQELTNMLRRHGSYAGFWIGLSDLVNEGSWKWIDGSSLTAQQQNWAGGQPDNKNGNQDCGYIARDHGYMVDDAECNIMFQVLCERKL